jgi:[ribosomal protein S18]-alanine N-acetyltransferase
MTAYTIRTANPGDIPSIMGIEQEAGTAAHWPKTEYERIFEAGGVPRIALIIESDGQILGFIVARCIDKEWELENVAVRPASRRHGLGRALVKHLLQLAGEASAAHVFLEVRESNRAARDLYSQLGFLETGCRPAYYSHPVEDAITYEMLLEYDQNH